jgi:hypothetical protein
MRLTFDPRLSPAVEASTIIRAIVGRHVDVKTASAAHTGTLAPEDAEVPEVLLLTPDGGGELLPIPWATIVEVRLIP